MIKYLQILLVSIAISSCNTSKNEFKSERDFISYLNEVDNGFIQSANSNDLKFETRLMPPIIGDNSPQITIQLRISKIDGNSVLKFENADQNIIQQRESYLSFEIIKDVFIESNGVEIEPNFHHYEKNYGIKPSVDLFFRFKSFVPEEDVYFNYRDQIFHQGLIKIKYNKELFTSCHVQK